MCSSRQSFGGTSTCMCHSKRGRPVAESAQASGNPPGTQELGHHFPGRNLCWMQVKRLELRSWAWLTQIGRLCTDGLPEHSDNPGSDLSARSKAFHVPSTSIQLDELLVVATQKADLNLVAPVTRKQQKVQQELLHLALHVSYELVKVSHLCLTST